MLAWLPYPDLPTLHRRQPDLPDGLEVAAVPDARALPDGIGEVGFFVLPYLTAHVGLKRIGEMSSLQVVQTLTAGYEDVIDHVSDPIALCNAAGLHDTSTAELAIGLTLANLRLIDEFAQRRSERRWDRRWGTSLADRRVLILGYGHIGQAIEARLAGFEVASVTRVARRARPAADRPVQPVEDLPALLPDVDVLILIAPLTEQTHHIVDAAALALLPDGALVVNVARGPLVDTDALLAETSSGRLRAALDVTDPEPLPPDHPLWSVPSVTLSPHVGGMSSAFHPRADRLIADQLSRWVAGEPLANRIR